MAVKVEATSGFEPLNRGFADLPLNHLGTSPRMQTAPRAVPPAGEPVLAQEIGCPSRIRTSPNGSKVRCPTTRRRGRGSIDRLKLARVGSVKEWSGRRDSNPRPSPWQGDALPTEPLPLECRAHRSCGAESQNRTGDTAIFSRVLYQLSYLGPVDRRPIGSDGATENSTGPLGPAIKRPAWSPSVEPSQRRHGRGIEWR